MPSVLIVSQESSGLWSVRSELNGTLIGDRKTRDAAVEFARDYAYHQDIDRVDVRLSPKQRDD